MIIYQPDLSLDWIGRGQPEVQLTAMVIPDIFSQDFCILYPCILRGLIAHPTEVVMRRRYDPLLELPKLCVHHWLCGDQDQMVVHAVCKKCGARAEFRQERCFGSIYYRPQPWNDPSMPSIQSGDEVSAIIVIGGY
jgi:hypothetical protein